MLMSDVFQKLRLFPSVFEHLEASEFCQFVTVAADFIHRNAGSHYVNKSHAPHHYLNLVLPRPQTSGTWEVLWYVMYSQLGQSYVEPNVLVRNKGLSQDEDDPCALVIPERVIWPPYKDFCPHEGCLAPAQSIKLERRPPVAAYLYDLEGVKSIRHHTTYCRYCQTSYRATYWASRKGPRVYYSADERKDQDFIEINQRYFVTKALLLSLNIHQSLAHVSIYSLVNMYNELHNLASPSPNHFKTSRFGPSMSDQTCTSGLELYRLLCHFDRRNRLLTVDSKAHTRHRFREAKMMVLSWLELEGSPYVDHICSQCTYITENEDVEGGGLAYRSIVMDGITIGHPRCSASVAQLVSLNPAIPDPPPCEEMLDTPHDRYCPLHARLLGRMCRVQPCTRRAVGSTQTCNLKSHQEAFALRNAKKSRTQGHLSLIQRTGSNIPVDPTSELDSNTDNFINLESLIDRDETDRAHEATREGEEAPQNPENPRLTVSNARTHNDFLFVGTCGIVLARETMYRAESVILVRQILERKFPVALPTIQFFDNACTFDKSLRKDEAAMKRFLGTIRPVDPFHMRSHSVKDASCRSHNDPHLWPVLKTEDGGWRFNASAAEMTNAWYGHFLSICRGMHEINYRFFLEEMILVRNKWLIAKLKKKTNFCSNLPSDFSNAKH